MWAIIIVTIGIILIEAPTLLRRGLKKELVVFSILLTIGAIYCTCYALGVEFATPYETIAQILKPLTDFIENAFK